MLCNLIKLLVLDPVCLPELVQVQVAVPVDTAPQLRNQIRIRTRFAWKNETGQH